MNHKDKLAYHHKVRENIENFGYNITYVFGDEESLPFCYSTGIYKSFDIPELFISGLPQNLSSELINNYVDSFTKTQIVTDIKIKTLIDIFPIILINVENERLEEYALSTKRFYGDEKYTYLQLIFPDTNGYFPFEEGYNYDQEIFGNLKP